MTSQINTARLSLRALSAIQLERCIKNIAGLEAELGIFIPPSVVDANVTRAINIKLTKMALVDSRLHDWFTYWLIVVKAVPAGAGFIGFKGYPDADGKAEIGYGIDSTYRNQGYVTEALQALGRWALARPECRALTATTVSNPASERVLEKSGWQKVRQADGSSDWEIQKLSFSDQTRAKGREYDRLDALTNQIED
jgi:[ribosomal protein S5]-alanine N-acetyltransferase